MMVVGNENGKMCEGGKTKDEQPGIRLLGSVGQAE